MAEVARARNQRGQGDRLRDEIITAATVLIDEATDPASVTLRGIARRAGISAPSIYPHFQDLAAILDAVLERSFADLDGVVATAMSAPAAADARLVAGCLAYVRYGWEHRSRYRFMIAGTGFAPGAGATFARIEAAVQACVEAGLSTSADPHSDAFLLWVSMHGMATLEKPDRRELRRLGPLDRVALTEQLARRVAGLPTVAARHLPSAHA
ncbi:TetR/AcrR family transcriptional regulator [Mycobacterium vicinigordonae]|uniref:TetR/AcrR family transcriptional regulator n=1 Tax=Mycobacterium vicinigordonae TaxID=1719132 RepID=A0A7D6E1J3_9MYCO|nr:TetR/AcrR family transcriptional regulator [Mycobacterium vicinigordonae]QLL05282.1 TetR/AcrR family transcriptional regulator [Mycobacterium vicinigordonae]